MSPFSAVSTLSLFSCEVILTMLSDVRDHHRGMYYTCHFVWSFYDLQYLLHFYHDQMLLFISARFHDNFHQAYAQAL